MILPFVTIGSKLIFCSLADRHRAYRTFFIVFLISALVGYGSFAVLPFLIKPPVKEEGYNRVTFALICLMTSVATISMSVLSCLSDAFAMNSTKKYKTSYGFLRVWGTLGWGFSALVLAFINNNKQLPYLVPGCIMTIILLSVDILIVVSWPNKDDFHLDKSASDVSCEDVITVLSQSSTSNQPNSNTNSSTGLSPLSKPAIPKDTNYGTTVANNNDRYKSSTQLTESSSGTLDVSSAKMQWILFKQVATRRKSIFRYMTLFTISGALIGLQWSYFFLYLEHTYKGDFTFISGISMVGQSMLGELPFFVLSQYVIKMLGRSHSLSISIASVGVRYLLYEYLLPNSSMYFVLLTETLQGPNFGLFYVVMTEVGLDYSDCEEAIVDVVNQRLVSNDAAEIDKLRQALRATMQSIMSACYEGLGVGIGSIVGGLVIDHYGFSTLWFYAAIIAIALGSINMLIDILGLPFCNDKKPQVILKGYP